MITPTLDDIHRAAERIRAHAHKTPLVTSGALDANTGRSIFLKCEQLQRVGAFKFRGACNAVMSLSAEEAERGVATHSSGNHAQALALAAKLRGVPAHVVMPSNSKAVKKAAVEGYGANITLCEPNLAARESTLEAVVQQTGATFVHPYDNPLIVAGQGTAALEVFAQVNDLDVIMAPVGGGGLISGTALAASERNTRVVAAEPSGADDAHRSFVAGKLIPQTAPDTIADGLLTSLGTLNFEIIRKHVDDIVTVTDEQIIEAMRFVWERTKMIVEPSSAVPVAAVMNDMVEGKRIGIILSGGNVDLGALPF